MKTTFFMLALCCSQLCSQVAWAKNGCTTHDVNGTYAFLADGSVLIPGQPVSGPFMRIGSFTADGKGGIVFSTLAIYNGINFGVEHFGGTYSVTSDCSIDLNLAVPAPINLSVEFKGQVADGGNDVTFMILKTASPQVPALTTVLGFSKSRSMGRCSTGDLDGSWRLEINGFRNLGTGGTAIPIRQLGHVQADGRGGLLVSFIASDNGVITQPTGAGTYSVSSDCNFDLKFSLNGSTSYIRGSFIDGDNAFVSLNQPGPAIPGLGGATLAGAVATGTMVQETSQSHSEGHGHSDHDD